MKVNLPQSWQDVTIKQFTELTRIKEVEPEEKIIELIAVLSGEDRERIAELTLASLQKAFKAISFINTQQIAGQIKEALTINSVKYLLNMDISKITAGQYIDIKEAVKDKNEIYYNIHTIMAALYIPEGKKYNEVSAVEIAEIFYEQMSIADAYPIAVFFCNLYNDLKKVTGDYSQRKHLREIAKQLDSANAGPGI